MLQSCGIADLIATSYGGRNRRLAEAFIVNLKESNEQHVAPKTLAQLEAEVLHGQKLQGPGTAREVFSVLQRDAIADQFPILVAVHKILLREMPPEAIIDACKNHKEHDDDHPVHFHDYPINGPH